MQKIREIDSVTPCMVGPRNYYKLWDLDDSAYMNLPNIIYTFNYFVPKDYAMGGNKVT